MYPFTGAAPPSQLHPLSSQDTHPKTCWTSPQTRSPWAAWYLDVLRTEWSTFRCLRNSWLCLLFSLRILWTPGACRSRSCARFGPTRWEALGRSLCRGCLWWEGRILWVVLGMRIVRLSLLFLRLLLRLVLFVWSSLCLCWVWRVHRLFFLLRFWELLLQL